MRIQVEGPEHERELKEFEGDRISIGRREECDLVLAHPTVSKEHAEIVREGDTYTVRDLDSYNGTYVNGNWQKEASLRPGDRIRLGRFELVFLGEEEDKVPPQAARPRREKRRPGGTHTERRVRPPTPRREHERKRPGPSPAKRQPRATEGSRPSDETVIDELRPPRTVRKQARPGFVSTGRGQLPKRGADKKEGASDEGAGAPPRAEHASPAAVAKDGGMPERDTVRRQGDAADDEPTVAELFGEKKTKEPVEEEPAKRPESASREKGATRPVHIDKEKATQREAPAKRPEPPQKEKAPPEPREALLTRIAGRGNERLFLVAVVLVVAILAALALILLSRNGVEEPDSSPPPSPASAAPAPAVGRVERGSDREPSTAGTVVSEVSRAAFVDRFEAEVEKILLARCIACHDGSHGGRFLLYDGLDRRLRVRLNFTALRPFVHLKDPVGSPILLAARGGQEHGGGKVVSPEELATLVGFVSDAAPAIVTGEGLWLARPLFPLIPQEAATGKEVALRRLFLDLIGRPPTEAELVRYGEAPFKETLDDLIAGEECRLHWKGEVSRSLKDVWNEDVTVTLTRDEVVARLAAFYEKMLPTRAPRRKTTIELVRSLVVDLWGRRPDNDEVDDLASAFTAMGPDLLPLAAFLLGDVEKVEDAPTWIDRVYVRFLLRPPRTEEREKAKQLLSREGGARILILALASSNDYRVY